VLQNILIRHGFRVRSIGAATVNITRCARARQAQAFPAFERSVTSRCVSSKVKFALLGENGAGNSAFEYILTAGPVFLRSLRCRARSRHRMVVTDNFFHSRAANVVGNRPVARNRRRSARQREACPKLDRVNDAVRNGEHPLPSAATFKLLTDGGNAGRTARFVLHRDPRPDYQRPQAIVA
jgi:hypothetical protein